MRNTRALNAARGPAKVRAPARRGGRAAWAGLALAIALACGARAAEERVTLNFTNAEIDAVVRAIGEFTGRAFVVDPRVKGTLNLTIERSLTREQAVAALTAALRMQGYSVVEAGGISRVVPEADAKLQGSGVYTGRAAGAVRGDEVVTQVFRLNYESAVAIAQVLRPMIAPNNTINAYAGNNSIVVTDYAENVRRIARIIAAIDTPAGSGIDVVRLEHAIASDVAALLSKLVDAMAQGADPNQRVTLLAEPSSNTLLIRSASPARTALVRELIAKFDQPSAVAGNIHVVYLKNAEAAQLARTLIGTGAGATGRPQPAAQPAIAQPAGAAPVAATAAGASTPVSGRVGDALIQADPTTNTLIVTAPEAIYKQLRAVIDKLDVRRAQVFIESLIVEVSSEQAAEFGVQWMGGMGRAATGGTGAVAGTNFGGAGQNIIGAAQNIASVGPGLNVGIVRGQFELAGVGTVANLNALARALEQTSQANILSTPTILTLDNEEARIVVGQNVPFITGQYLNPGAGGGVTVNPFQTIERKDVGLTLRVRPQISEGGTIKMVIYQEVSSVEDRTVAAGIITNKRSIETNVLVDDGAIVALGGLIQDNVSEGVDKVPLLGDLPLIGGLFRYESRKQRKTNLMVFLRPMVVRDEKTANSLAVDRYDQMRSVQEETAPKSHWLLPDMAPPVLPPREDAPAGERPQGGEPPAPGGEAPSGAPEGTAPR